MKTVPDDTKVTITQPTDGKITLVVITTKGESNKGYSDTLGFGEPGANVDSSTALSFAMPHDRSSLLIEAYYPIKGAGGSTLILHWDNNDHIPRQVA